MLNLLRNFVALILGVAVGGGVNMALIVFGPLLIPPPAGADMATAEGLRAAMPMLEPRHFLMPWLAHALGTLVGALVGALVAPSHRLFIAGVIGILFLAGGVAASLVIPAPAWFIAVDLALAYLPMAAAGWWLARRFSPSRSSPAARPR